MRSSMNRRSRWGAFGTLAFVLVACASKRLELEDPNADGGGGAPASTPPGDLACGPKFFRCIDRSVITIWWVCDGVSDCVQGEDEEGCPNRCQLPDLDELGPDEDSDCEGVGQAFAACGLLSTPEVYPCWDGQRLAQCQFGCYAEASCAELVDNVCTPIATPALDRCLAECSAKPYFCEDGTRIPSNWECDGETDCVSGEDELGCPTFPCDSGSAIPGGWVCDGVSDCTGGEDELECKFVNCPQ